MSSKSNWLPELLLLEDCDGSWARYVDEVFSIFYRDFIETQPRFQDKWVRCRRDLIDGKEAAFWHCISEGPNENDRRLAIRRCERIGWVRAIINIMKILTLIVGLNEGKVAFGGYYGTMRSILLSSKNDIVSAITLTICSY